MFKSLCHLAVCVNDLKNELLMTKISLNIINIIIFRMMQSLKRKIIKKYHKNLLSRYFETQKILNLIPRKYH